jgi:hypothetical protein
MDVHAAAGARHPEPIVRPVTAPFGLLVGALGTILIGHAVFDHIDTEPATIVIETAPRNAEATG